MTSRPICLTDTEWVNALRAYQIRAWRPARVVVVCVAGAVLLLLIGIGVARGLPAALQVAQFWVPLLVLLPAWWLLPRLASRATVRRSKYSRFFEQPSTVSISAEGVVITAAEVSERVPLSALRLVHAFQGSLVLWANSRDFLLIPSVPREELERVTGLLSRANVPLRAL